MWSKACAQPRDLVVAAQLDARAEVALREPSRPICPRRPECWSSRLVTVKPNVERDDRGEDQQQEQEGQVVRVQEHQRRGGHDIDEGDDQPGAEGHVRRVRRLPRRRFAQRDRPPAEHQRAAPGYGQEEDQLLARPSPARP